MDQTAAVHMAMGRWLDCVQAYQGLPAEIRSEPQYGLAICYAHLGETARAGEILARLETEARRRYVDKTTIATIYAALGDHASASPGCRAPTRITRRDCSSSRSSPSSYRCGRIRATRSWSRASGWRGRGRAVDHVRLRTFGGYSSAIVVGADHAANFLGLVRLGCLVILFRAFVR